MASGVLYYSNRCAYCKEVLDAIGRAGRRPEAVFRLHCIDAARPPPDVRCVPCVRTADGGTLLVDDALFDHVHALLRPPPQPYASDNRLNEGFAFLGPGDAAVFESQSFEYVDRGYAAPPPLPAAAAAAASAPAPAQRTYEQLMQDRERDIKALVGGGPP